jgi:Fe-S-cluster containining protein
VPFSPSEAKAAFKVSGKRPTVIPGPGGLTCGYVRQGGGCEIYEVRPLICRLFGAVDRLALNCHHGVKAENPLTSLESSELVKLHCALTKGKLIIPEIAGGSR